ncbi:ABC transporter substrate-binding protein [Brooklawnia cerclae]|uniref:peptide ABC transporter substrate-binding protein n=1 Tax=Brooklawnia cerclae TaxID=349934 RepID=UPI0031D46AA0
MRKSIRYAAVASAAALSLVLAACGSGGSSDDSSSGSASGGDIVIRGCTPENPLIPGNTSETCGGDMIDAFTAKLIHYNTETAEPEMDIAESIETDDSTLFTVKLKQGYKFQDGTEVQAHNFVDAWNYTAAYENGQAGAYFFTPIKGYEDVAEEGATATEMEGLTIVDDYTFTIETSEPTSNLPVRLGYSAFAPLPDSFFDDPAAFEDNPIGAGPFQYDSSSTSEFKFTKFADYSGAYPAHVDSLTFRIYTDDSAAYNDVVANNLDYTNTIPTDFLVGDQWESDLSGRQLSREAGVFQAVVFSPNDPQLADNVDLRRAISMAVDRDLITQQIFNGSRTPAHGWAPSIVDGATDTACGDNCTYDPEAAKTLYDQAGGYDGTLTLTVNGDADHKPWADAVCNSIKNALGLECVTQVTPDFATFNDMIDAHEIQGLFRSGWQMDYPSIENFLAPIYGTGADSNWSGYSNPDFDAKLTEAAAATSVDEANTLYQEAEAMLGQDMPTMPMWYNTAQVGWSENVDNVECGLRR